MEAYEILHALREAKAQIIHLQEMFNSHTGQKEDFATTSDAIKLIDRTIDDLKTITNHGNTNQNQ